MIKTKLKGLKFIGRGSRSRVYAYSRGKVLKVTRSLKERDLLEFMLESPRDYFVKVYEFEKKNHDYYAVLERLPNTKFVSWKLKEKESYFYESVYLDYSFFNALEDKRESFYVADILEKVEAPVEKILEYYGLLKEAYLDGLDVYDVAWNLGRRKDGSLCCYDAEFFGPCPEYSHDYKPKHKKKYSQKHSYEYS